MIYSQRMCPIPQCGLRKGAVHTLLPKHVCHHWTCISSDVIINMTNDYLAGAGIIEQFVPYKVTYSCLLHDLFRILCWGSGQVQSPPVLLKIYSLQDSCFWIMCITLVWFGMLICYFYITLFLNPCPCLVSIQIQIKWISTWHDRTCIQEPHRGQHYSKPPRMGVEGWDNQYICSKLMT